MRKELRKMSTSMSVPDTHFGLAYDVWAPVCVDPKNADNFGKLTSDDDRVNGRFHWMQQLEKVSIDSDYQHAFQQWRRSHQGEGSIMVEVEFNSRLLIGHGNPTAAENGLTVHHTWGAPLIPGSALKGLLNHFMEVEYGPVDDDHDPEREDWRGVTWDKNRIVAGPGLFHKMLFGAPEVDKDHKAQRGRVIFHDAWMVPGPQNPFARDVLTPHQTEYYRGKRGPSDWDSPNPVSLMTVRPGIKFLLVLSGDTDWTRLALKQLLHALCDWGVGGKTVAGYGRILSQEVDSALESLKTPEEHARQWIEQQSEQQLLNWVERNKVNIQENKLDVESQVQLQVLKESEYPSFWILGNKCDSKTSTQAKILTHLASLLGVEAPQTTSEQEEDPLAQWRTRISETEQNSNKWYALVNVAIQEGDWPVDALQSLDKAHKSAGINKRRIKKNNLKIFDALSKHIKQRSQES